MVTTQKNDMKLEVWHNDSENAIYYFVFIIKELHDKKSVTLKWKREWLS